LTTTTLSAVANAGIAMGQALILAWVARRLIARSNSSSAAGLSGRPA
jgi:hypothetical protein